MIYIYKDDFYSVSVDSLITDVDVSTILNLYQPLLGSRSSNMYFTFLEEYKNIFSKKSEEIKHENLFSKTQLTAGEFLNARKLLESLGLISTYYKKDQKNVGSYLYVLHAPKTPKVFFDDPLFKNLLVKYIGAEETKKIAKNYELNIDTSGYENISASFEETFHIDTFNLENSFDLGSNIIGRKEGQVKEDFDLKEFFNFLKNHGCDGEKLLSEKETKQIISLAVSNSLNEVLIGEAVLDCLELNNELGKRLNLNLLNNKCITNSHFAPLSKKKETEKNIIEMSSDSKQAKKLNLIQTTKPELFISYLQENIPASYTDKLIINYLRTDQKLEDEVINVIIDYCLLYKEKPCFNKKYVSAVASTLIKNKKHKSCLDAINFLYYSTDKKPMEKSNKKDIIDKTKGGIEFKPRFTEDERNQLIRELEENTYGKSK